MTRALWLIVLAVTAVARPPEPGVRLAPRPRDDGMRSGEPEWADPRLGDLYGVVQFPGNPPADATLTITKDTPVCGTSAPAGRLLVDARGGLANAVVWVADAASEPLDPRGHPIAWLDQGHCRYEPHVQAVRIGTELKLLNSDPILHNIHAYLDGTRTKFNVATVPAGPGQSRVLDEPGVLYLQCDAGHTWMSAYVHIFPHSKYAITDEHGGFTIRKINPGRHTIKMWHEGWTVTQVGASVKFAPPIVKTATVDVKAGGTSTLTFEVK